MRKQIVKVVTGVAIFALAATAALADVSTGRVVTASDFQLDGVTVRQGEYKLSFDDKSGELSIRDTAGKVVARAKAHAEQSQEKNRGTSITTDAQGGAQVLRSVRFAGERQRIVVGEAGADASAAGRSQ